MKKHWILAAVLTICGLAIPATIAIRLCDRDNWAFGPRSVEWVYGDGKRVPRNPEELYPWDGCEPNDIGFNTLRHDGALWTVCDNPERDGNVGMARIDPGAGVGTIWRFPEELPHVATRGIAVTRSGRIAIVYWTPDLHEHLAVAVIDRTGWRVPATLLPDSSGADVIATSYARGRLEVIYQPSHAVGGALANRMPIIATVGSSNIRIERFPAPPECEDRCKSPCRLLLRQDRWRVWIPAIDPAGGWKMIEVSEHGKHRVVDDVEPEEGCTTRQNDRAALGVTEVAGEVALRTEDARAQSIRGELRAFAPPPNSSWQPSMYSWLEPAPIGLQRRMMWSVDAGWARPHGDGWLVLSTEAHANEALAATVLDERGRPQQTRVIARAPSYFGGKVQIGVPLQRPDGGFWLVSQDGYYIAVDNDLKRLDPLPVFEHLRARGSLNPEWDEVQHVYKFLWALVGLPLCLLLAAGIAFARRKSIGHAMAWGAAVFVVTGGWCLSGVYPLLF